MEMCKVMWFAVLQIVAFSTQILSAPAHEDTVNWNLHKRRITKFRCGTPQLRSFQLEDIVEATHELLSFDTKVFPEMTALHRCDSQSGCCKSSKLDPKVCGPVEQEEVTLIFRNVPIIGVPSMGKYIRVVATNHTKCGCRSPINRPK